MNIITADITGNTLTLYATGRIDSQNATETEELINREINANPSADVILDAKNLDYISSAGLRVTLRLKKSRPSLKIINASSEIYEIFEMTGFTEIIDISKAFREFSVDGCEVIGKGANGEVYRVGSDTIIKVYFNADSLPDIERERQLARRAFVLGIPTAIPYDVVKVGNLYGSVFELLNAESFTKMLNKNPDSFDGIAKMFVDLLKKIHSTEVQPEDMPDMKQIVLSWVDYIENYIDRSKWEKLHKLVVDVPQSYKMIHGDFHTKNVMMQNSEVLLIDMDTLSHGNAVFEFAQIYNDFIGFYDFAGCEGINFIGLTDEMSKAFFNKTASLYFGTDDKEELEKYINKAKLIGHTRLLRRCIKHNGSAEEKEFYKNSIENLIDNTDSLAY